MKSIIKKHISGILAFCMILSLMSFSASAASAVSIINLTVKAPIAGNTPSDTATLPAKASTQVLSVKWTPSDTVFKKNTDYTVTVEIGIKPDLDKYFSSAEKMTVKVNGNKTTNVTKNGNTVTVKYTWFLAQGSNGTNDSITPSKTTQADENTQKTAQSAKSFKDVRDDAYYAAAVKWAVDKNITTGTSATTFSPDDTCTRAQILTFLWRAVGSPKYNSFMAFNDVISNAYYFDAATWAKGKDMVSGNMFEPNLPCTRAFTVLYLWKNAGSPKTEATNVFSDVDSSADYAQAVSWAVKNGVTSGTSATTFSPNDTCTRGQIVTFLNRALASANTTVAKTDDTKKDEPAKKDNEQTETKPTETTEKDTQKDTEKNTEKNTETTNPTNDEIDNINNWRKPGVFTSIRPKYDTAVYEARIKEAMKEALGDNMGASMTDLQKALALHDWLALNCQYDETKRRKYAYSEYGAIVEGIAVCQGYTLAYNDLLTRAGIEAEYAAGWAGTSSADSGRHSWSRVTINGKKYFVDVTWDDATPNIQGRVAHSFFMVSDKALYYHSQYNVHCTDTTYDDCLLQELTTPLFWNEEAKKFYYIDRYDIKMTSDFSEKITSAKNKNDFGADCAVMTDDKKYIAYFKPTNYTSEYPLYLYSVDTDEYFTYKIKDVKNVIFCGMRLNGYNVEVVREYYQNSAPYMTKVIESVPIPKNFQNRTVTFDQNYSGGKTSSCEYLNNYWTNGEGSFEEPKRSGFTFGGWYTEKDGGTKAENFEEIPNGCTTLYAHWWGEWKITEEPTMTESGKAARSLDGYPNITEEKEIPNLSDTSVWKKSYSKPATTTNEGWQRYTSEYGEVKVTIPKEEYKYGIFYKDGSVFITVLEETTYIVKFKSADAEAQMKVITNGEGEYRVMYPKTFTPSGKMTATLYDSEMNEICSTEYEVK